MTTLHDLEVLVGDDLALLSYEQRQAAAEKARRTARRARIEENAEAMKRGFWGPTMAPSRH